MLLPGPWTIKERAFFVGCSGFLLVLGEDLGVVFFEKDTRSKSIGVVKVPAGCGWGEFGSLSFYFGIKGSLSSATFVSVFPPSKVFISSWSFSWSWSRFSSACCFYSASIFFYSLCSSTSFSSGNFFSISVGLNCSDGDLEFLPMLKSTDAFLSEEPVSPTAFSSSLSVTLGRDSGVKI